MLLCLSAALVLTGCEDEGFGNGNNAGNENDYFKLSDDKCVELAASNLYWDGAGFHFEQNAYDFPQAWDETHVGHFYWSKNLDQTYIKYYDEYQTAQISDVFCWDERCSTARSVDGDTGWYVPASQEWDYLISHHTYLYCNLVKAAGDTVFGLMVLPYGSKEFLQQGRKVTPSKKSTYDLSMADLQSNLEHHAVFLPGAFNRDGTQIRSSRDGEYLSSSPLLSMSSSAECFNFYEYGISAWFMLGRCFGGSIRLVRNI